MQFHLHAGINLLIPGAAVTKRWFWSLQHCSLRNEASQYRKLGEVAHFNEYLWALFALCTLLHSTSVIWIPSLVIVCTLAAKMLARFRVEKLYKLSAHL